MKRLAVVLAALTLAGCAGGGGGHDGTATLWVTRDRGAHVVFSGDVPTGLNAIQTVERKLKVTTRYGGRYVQSIDGVAGSLGAQRDWFYYLDGVEGDRSAAEVRLHAGDVLWWDYRRWTPATEHIPAVAGAYPHPFVDRGPTRVVANDATLARRLARQVHGVANAKRPLRNAIVVADTLPPDQAQIRQAADGYVLELGPRIARKLAGDPNALRYRF
ncbi:MAG TPA: DUF4430 domain-containing protein [Gaiellaceae bacterium]|jgi:hypothetical protein|nr:DUF4430 domain-containing protein [Gaiellaceae bacterium]